MIDLLKIVAVFALIVAMLRRKHKVGLVMFSGAALLGLLYRMPPLRVAATIRSMFYDGITIRLLTALLLIRVLEVTMRERNLMDRMMKAARGVLRSRRATLISMPLLIGMLPSIGGAYFSAPMVEEASKGTCLGPGAKGFINYWFRHVWEMILPLYPGVLLASALSGVPLRTLIVANMGCALTMAATGLAFGFRDLGAKTGPPEGAGAQVAPSMADLGSFLPILGVLFGVMALGAGLMTSLATVIAGMFLFYRYGPGRIAGALKAGFSWDVVFLIGGIMFFKGVMEGSGAVANLSAYLRSEGIPLGLMLCTLPFLTGLMTGLTIGFVSATFPLLLSLPGGMEPAAVSLAFVAGYIGVLLSPVHVCLVLTREYFGADMASMYGRVLPHVGAVLAFAIAQYMIMGALP